MSEPRIHRVGVVAKGTSAEAVDTALELAQWLRRHHIHVALDALTLAARGLKEPLFSPAEPWDLVVVLGGDGTLLSVARSLAAVPILGVNLGNLGFLTEISRGELYPALVEILAGHFRSEQRTLLDAEIHRRDGSVSPPFRVMNDAVVTKGALARIIELQLEVDG
ncbi:MAG TPA: NAD(+)/NADH kinase, partial [Thermoanaerobaculia bacterium]